MSSIISIKQRGNFNRTRKYFERLNNSTQLIDLKKYGEEGVEALRNATPVNTGLTASSWHYKIEKSRNRVGISWYNTNVQNGMNIALLIQYGHGTRSGAIVYGVDYINPALKPIFDKMAKEIWAEVTKI